MCFIQEHRCYEHVNVLSNKNDYSYRIRSFHLIMQRKSTVRMLFLQPSKLGLTFCVQSFSFTHLNIFKSATFI